MPLLQYGPLVNEENGICGFSFLEHKLLSHQVNADDGVGKVKHICFIQLLWPVLRQEGLYFANMQSAT